MYAVSPLAVVCRAEVSIVRTGESVGHVIPRTPDHRVAHVDSTLVCVVAGIVLHTCTLAVRAHIIVRTDIFVVAWGAILDRVQLTFPSCRIALVWNARVGRHFALNRGAVRHAFVLHADEHSVAQVAIVLVRAVFIGHAIANHLTRSALAAGAGIPLGARISVIAWFSIISGYAPLVGRTRVVGTRVAVVTGLALVENPAPALILHALMQQLDARAMSLVWAALVDACLRRRKVDIDGSALALGVPASRLVYRDVGKGGHFGIRTAIPL